jgi:hypothetical protein
MRTNDFKALTSLLRKLFWPVEALLCKLLIDSRNEIILWHCLFFNGLTSFGFATSGFTL